MTKFTFNKTTGTLEPNAQQQTSESIVEQPEMEVPNANNEIVNIAEKADQSNLSSTDDEAEIVFKQFSDLSVMRIDDQATGKWLCYFSGYALDIKFNMEELKGVHATKKIEAALEGLNKLFRKIILDQAVGG